MTQRSTLAPEGDDPALEVGFSPWSLNVFHTGLSGATAYIPLLRCAASGSDPALKALYRLSLTVWL
jgi:hypothetical protein